MYQVFIFLHDHFHFFLHFFFPFMEQLFLDVKTFLLNQGLDAVEKWARSHCIMRHGYSGGGFDGNNCKRILDNCEKLRYELPDALECWPAIDALKALQDVCNGTRDLGS